MKRFDEVRRPPVCSVVGGVVALACMSVSALAQDAIELRSVDGGGVEQTRLAISSGAGAEVKLSVTFNAQGNAITGLPAPAAADHAATRGWVESNFGGTVTSISAGTPGAVTGTSGLSFSANPITSAGSISIATGGVTNAMLANPSLTVSAGTGLSGGGTVSLGGSTTLALANTAVAAGSYGSASSAGTFTVDAQGRLTAAGSATISIDINANTTGTLAIGRGGTGLTSSGAVGNYLRSNGTSWSSSAIQAGDLPAGSGYYLARNAADTSSAAQSGGYLYSLTNTAAGAGTGGLSVTASGLAAGDGTAILGTASSSVAALATRWNVGVRGQAEGNVTAATATLNNVGLYGRAAGNQGASEGTINAYGVYGIAQATGSSSGADLNNYGVYGSATSVLGFTAYGVYGVAAGPGSNWAGYFAGNANVQGGLYTGGVQRVGVTGTISNATWGGNAISTQRGGTGQNWSAVGAGSLPYFSVAGAMGTLAPGTGGQYLRSGGAGAPTWDTLDASDVSSFSLVQNGNSFGTTATIGTNDAYSLLFETAGVTRLTLDTAGNATLTGTLAVGGNVNVGGSLMFPANGGTLVRFYRRYPLVETTATFYSDTYVDIRWNVSGFSGYVEFSPKSGAEGWWDYVSSGVVANDGEFDYDAYNWGDMFRCRASRRDTVVGTWYRCSFAMELNENGGALIYLNKEGSSLFPSYVLKVHKPNNAYVNMTVLLEVYDSVA